MSRGAGSYRMPALPSPLGHCTDAVRAFVSRAMADNKSLSIVQWSHFIPAYDKWFDQFAKPGREEQGGCHGRPHPHAECSQERPPGVGRIGRGIFGFAGAGGAHLYRKYLTDVADLVKETEKKYGTVTAMGKQIGYNADDGSWSAFPNFYINYPGMYQKSLWDGIGMLPDTWENVRVGGAKLKAKGHPVGIPLGHSNDPNTNWRGLMWSYGSFVQDEHGKQIVLDSKETVEAVKLAAAIYKEAMTTDVSSWNDASNNQYINSGVGCYMINPISAYRTAQKLNKKLADDIYVIKPPKGPKGQIMGVASILRHLEIRQEQGSGEGVPQALFGKLA